MRVRAAIASDSTQIAPLLVDSAEALLSSLFEANREQLEAFFVHCLRHSAGQYGYTNHVVVEHQDKIIGLGSCWHKGLPEGFDKASVLALHQYWGMQKSLQILSRNQQIACALVAPGDDALSLGHIAVDRAHRRQGCGCMLLEHFRQLAQKLGKTRLILDVQQNNIAAIKLYLSDGFELVKQSADISLDGATIQGFCHMQKSL